MYVTHQKVINLIGKGNKHLALRLQLDSMALRLLLSATVLEVSLLIKIAFISAILQTALDVKGYLVLNTRFLRKKSRLVRYRMVECFHAITIDAKHLYFYRCGPYCIISLQEINRFLETLSRFCIFEKALFLDPQDSILEHFEHRGSSIEAQASRLEDRVPSVNLLWSGTVVHPCFWQLGILAFPLHISTPSMFSTAVLLATFCFDFFF